MKHEKIGEPVSPQMQYEMETNCSALNCYDENGKTKIHYYQEYVFWLEKKLIEAHQSTPIHREEEKQIQLERDFIEMLVEFEPQLKLEEGSDSFFGYFVHWDDIVKLFPNKTWGNSPIELIVDLINERDKLLEQSKTPIHLTSEQRQQIFDVVHSYCDYALMDDELNAIENIVYPKQYPYVLKDEEKEPSQSTPIHKEMEKLLIVAKTGKISKETQGIIDILQHLQSFPAGEWTDETVELAYKEGQLFQAGNPKALDYPTWIAYRKQQEGK